MSYYVLLHPHQKLAKENRALRAGRITTIQNQIFERVADYYGIDTTEVVDGILDDDNYVSLVEHYIVENGLAAIAFSYHKMAPPPIRSGRYDPTLNKTKVNRAICSTLAEARLTELYVIVYRTRTNVQINSRNFGEEVFIIPISVPEGSSLLAAFSEHLDQVFGPSLKTLQDFGMCLAQEKLEFIHGFDNFKKFIKTTDEDSNGCDHFEVDHMLYKGFLLVPHQIQESAMNPAKVAEIEIHFSRWLQQMEIALTQGNQIRRHTIDDGPLKELNHWRHWLIRYAKIVEFVATRAFQSHLKCMTLSRSKLVKRYEELDYKLTVAHCEARDNVRYMSSIEKFWTVLYMCNPSEISSSLSILIEIIREVYNTSQFYNAPSTISIFLTKITNQLTLAAENYLTNGGSVSVWTQVYEQLVVKIESCQELFETYKELYHKTVREMERNPKELTWDCSESMIFGNIILLTARLEKITKICETQKKYSILDRIKISGMEEFETIIKNAYLEITSQTNSPLAYHLSKFNDDFEKFVQKIEIAEEKIKKFVKNYIRDIPNTDGMILALKRFERLGLNCLCMDRRYLDVVGQLQKEIDRVKDV